MRIQTESFFDYKTFRAYFFNLLFKRWPARILRIVFILEVILLLTFVIANFIMSGQIDLEILFLGLIVISISGSYFIVLFLMAYFLYKKNKQAYSTKTTYLFDKDYFMVGLSGHNIHQGVKIEYKQVHKVEEVKNYFFLHLFNHRTYVIRKDLFEGDSNNLRVLLIAYFHKNYLLKCR